MGHLTWSEGQRWVLVGARLQGSLEGSRSAGQKQARVILPEGAAHEKGHGWYCNKANETWLREQREWFEMSLKRWVWGSLGFRTTWRILAFIIVGHRFPVSIISHHYFQGPQYPFVDCCQALAFWFLSLAYYFLTTGVDIADVTKTVILSAMLSSAENAKEGTKQEGFTERWYLIISMSPGRHGHCKLYPDADVSLYQVADWRSNIGCECDQVDLLERYLLRVIWRMG